MTPAREQQLHIELLLKCRNPAKHVCLQITKYCCCQVDDSYSNKLSFIILHFILTDTKQSAVGGCLSSPPGPQLPQNHIPDDLAATDYYQDSPATKCQMHA
jgi:hypothetical protein